MMGEMQTTWIFILLVLAGYAAVVFWTKFKNPKPQTKNTGHKSNPNKTGKIVKVNSFSDDSVYLVDLINITCTCPDFQQTRYQYDTKDPRRLCKHLVGRRAMSKHFDLETRREIRSVPAGSGYPIGERIQCRVNDDLITAVIPNDKTRKWIDVFYNSKRYGFHVSEQRWSYNRCTKKPKYVSSWILEAWNKIHSKASE